MHARRRSARYAPMPAYAYNSRMRRLRQACARANSHIQSLLYYCDYCEMALLRNGRDGRHALPYLAAMLGRSAWPSAICRTMPPHSAAALGRLQFAVLCRRTMPPHSATCNLPHYATAFGRRARPSAICRTMPPHSAAALGRRARPSAIYRTMPPHSATAFGQPRLATLCRMPAVLSNALSRPRSAAAIRRHSPAN